MRILMFSVLFAIASTALAQECESVVALSKVVSTVVSDKDSVDQHAANFCSEYAKSSGNSSSASFGASYKFLSASFGSSNASVEEVASKYCSASNSFSATKDAYRQYIESISPNAYSAYEQCLRMTAKQDLRFNVDLASVLPAQFAMSVAFTSSVSGSSTAKVTYSTSDGVKCKWDGTSEPTRTMLSGSSAILDCSRADQTKRGFVKVVRSDSSSDPLTVPWVAYSKEGVPVDTLVALQKSIIDLQEQVNIKTSAISALPVYRCPFGTGGWNPGGQWASYGCQGQLSTEPSCTNIEYPNNQKRDCTLVGTIRLY